MSENKQSETESEMLLSETQAAPQTAASQECAPSPEGEGDPVPDWLQKGLKKLYADVMDEPVPDEFAKLLKQLADKERG
jgi:hypothetical protein